MGHAENPAGFTKLNLHQSVPISSTLRCKQPGETSQTYREMTSVTEVLESCVVVRCVVSFFEALYSATLHFVILC